MKKFILNIGKFLVLSVFTFLGLGFLADGHTDPFYLRFTSSKKSSLILGSSRAAQGLQPKIFNKILSASNLDIPVYNFGFTVHHSPYGALYLKAIQQKIAQKTKNGLFILAVDPWCISSKNNIDYNREDKLEMAKIIFFNAAPNYDYLINSYPKASILKLVVDRFQVDSAMILQNDGWLQVNVNMEKAVVEKRTKEKIEEYKNDNFITFKKSKNRILYLEKTIQYLKNYGSVFLVRLPVESRMEEMETQLMPEFDSIMGELSEINQIPYLNYMPSSKSYTFTDGNHLYKTSGKKISKQIAKDIHTLIAN